MRETNFLEDAKLFSAERDKFAKRFATGESKEDVGHIRDAMAEGAPIKNKEAIVKYLNVLINGSRRIFKLVNYRCGNDLFKKLIKAGLRGV